MFSKFAEGKNCMKNILVVLPMPQDKSVLKNYTDCFNLHWLTDENFKFQQPKPFKPDSKFELVKYTERCSEYIKNNNIEGIFYSHDLASMVAGILCERHNLPGPSFESMFLANHKYYSRSNESSPIDFNYIDIETGEWNNNKEIYPCYIKPPTLMSSLLQFKIESKKDLQQVLDKIRPELLPWSNMFSPFFREYVNLKKYPLAVQNIVLAEELVTGAREFIIEGWTDKNGKAKIWAVTDSNYFGDAPHTIDYYMTPSRQSPESIKKMIDYSIDVVNIHGIKNGFWNVELWLKGGTYFLTEVNGRASSIWQKFYQGVYEKSLYKAMLHLCCGDIDLCLEETPYSSEKRELFGGQYHLSTFGEGKANLFLDFEKANLLDGYLMELCLDEDFYIRQLRTRGVRLAMFYLFGDDLTELASKARDLRHILLKQPELSPKVSSIK